jgi:hypothetical protein
MEEAARLHGAVASVLVAMQTEKRLECRAAKRWQKP